MSEERMAAPPLAVKYRNWRGEEAVRRIVPVRVWFGACSWHPEPQWLLDAVDADKGEERTFAMKGILGPGE